MPRVLIIEDEPDTQDLLTDILSLEGYEVRSTSEAAGALSLARRLKPDLIILDLRLPGIGGLDLLRLLSTDPALQRVRVLLCTAAREEIQNHAAEIEQLGATVLEKPFELDDLLNAVKRSLKTTKSPVSPASRPHR